MLQALEHSFCRVLLSGFAVLLGRHSARRAGLPRDARASVADDKAWLPALIYHRRDSNKRTGVALRSWPCSSSRTAATDSRDENLSARFPAATGGSRWRRGKQGRTTLRRPPLPYNQRGSHRAVPEPLFSQSRPKKTVHLKRTLRQPTCRKIAGFTIWSLCVRGIQVQILLGPPLLRFQNSVGLWSLTPLSLASAAVRTIRNGNSPQAQR